MVTTFRARLELDHDLIGLPGNFDRARVYPIGCEGYFCSDIATTFCEALNLLGQRHEYAHTNGHQDQHTDQYSYKWQLGVDWDRLLLECDDHL